MAIELVIGEPGAGKSYFAVRELAAAVEKGLPVATNVALVPDWSIKLARRSVWCRLSRKRAVRRAARYRRLVFFSQDLDELFRVRLAGQGEDRGLMILDEAHNWLNARTWDGDEHGGTKREAIARRLRVVRFFSQHRKLGWRVLLITQDDKNLDRQVRDLFAFRVQLRNLRRFRFLGMPVCPFNFFVAIKSNNDAAATRAGLVVYTLDRGLARLYDTMALSHGLEDEDAADLIWLPHHDPDLAGAGGETGGRPAAGAPITRIIASAQTETPSSAPIALEQLVGVVTALQARPGPAGHHTGSIGQDTATPARSAGGDDQVQEPDALDLPRESAPLPTQPSPSSGTAPMLRPVAFTTEPPLDEQRARVTGLSAVTTPGPAGDGRPGS